MQLYSSLRGLPAFTLNQGRKIGQLDEVLVDAAQRTMGWLRFKGRGWLGKPRWVPAPAVHGLGSDAVILSSDEAVSQAPQLPEGAHFLLARQDLLGKPVLTETGRRLGLLRDYEFSPETLAITVLCVAQRFGVSGQLELIPIDCVMILGEDAIIVTRDTAGTPIRDGEHRDSDQ